MAIIKQSFLSNIMGKTAYNEVRGYAKIIIVIGTIVLAILYGLTFICHYGFVSSLLSFVSGTSILFCVYILALIIVLDIKVGVDVPETDIWEKPVRTPKPTKYKLTIVWGVILVLFGIAAIFFSGKYSDRYAFECETFLVDKDTKTYHIDCDNGCEEAAKSNNLVRMQGYQIDKTYTYCESCKEWAEEAEADTKHDYSNY